MKPWNKIPGMEMVTILGRGASSTIPIKEDGKQMIKEEWDKTHNYTRERNCAFCKNARDISTDFYTTKLKCLEKERAGDGATVKTNCCCDMWEHR
jgi:hypothetical protein